MYVCMYACMYVLTEGVTLNIIDELMSAPYVHMTMNLIKKFGGEVSSKDDLEFTVQPGNFFISYFTHHVIM